MSQDPYRAGAHVVRPPGARSYRDRPPVTPSRARGARILVRRLHLWLGLGLGGLFALLGLTGSILIFQIELDRALNPVIAAPVERAEIGWSSPAWDTALATAAERWPHADGKWSLEATGTDGPIPARYYPPAMGSGHHAERMMVWFSPNGDRVLRVDRWGGYATSWIYELHMHLLSGEAGRQVVGWTGYAMLVLLASGLVAWWPRGSWRKALAFKRDAAPIRRLRDLHKLTGLWSLGLLVVLVATGAFLALPQTRDAALGMVVARPDAVPVPTVEPQNSRPVPVAAALATARPAMPDGTLAFIDVPGRGSTEPIRIRVQAPGDPHRRFPGSFVFVDPGSGRVLAVHDIRRGNAGTAIAAWFRSLHDGSVGGLGTRILAAAIGLVPLALFLTGILHWRRRLARGRISHTPFKDIPA